MNNFGLFITPTHGILFFYLWCQIGKL